MRDEFQIQGLRDDGVAADEVTHPSERDSEVLLHDKQCDLLAVRVHMVAAGVPVFRHARSHHGTLEDMDDQMHPAL